MIDSTPWIDRAHGGRRTIPFPLTVAERQELEQLLRLGTVERRIALRAQALLLLADGVTGHDAAMLLGVNDATVDKWKRKVKLRRGDILSKLADAPRSGRPRALSRPQTERRSSQKRAASRAT